MKPRSLTLPALAALTALLGLAHLPAQAIGRLADVTIVDRDTGATLPVHYARGEYWVAGRPGARYAITVRNRLGERVLVVPSVDGVNVLSGDALRERQASTLGETLKHEVGVHSSYYGPVASSPIIRGLEGPRVLVTQNGLDAGDASRVGPDHAVAAEASTARQIEILRGPATLFYGSGAIGGVVNVVDDRVPQSTDTNGEWRLQQDSVADDKLVSASGNTGIGSMGLHLDGFWREADQGLRSSSSSPAFFCGPSAALRCLAAASLAARRRALASGSEGSLVWDWSCFGLSASAATTSMPSDLSHSNLGANRP